jgi:Na+-transporting methylmalonyl-CoA/oxaloacetate decarboxylase gamma subunit
MASHKLSTITSIFLSSVIVLLTGLSITIFHDSKFFIFLLILIFFVSSFSAFFTTFIKDQKDNISYHILWYLFDRKRPSSKAENKATGSDDPSKYKDYTAHDKGTEPDGPNEKWEYKVYEEDNLKCDQESTISLNEYLRKNNYYLQDEIIEAIEWKRFELLCHLIFKASGYNSELTGNGADKGVDIRIFDKNFPRKILYFAQCKKWQKNIKIQRDKIQQLRGQMATENVEKGFYCFTCRVTLLAKEYAEENNIELLDQQKIIESFNKLSLYDRQLILKDLLAGDYWTPSCARCGEKFELIEQKNGKMKWGCKKIKEHGFSNINYYDAAPIINVR